MTSVESPLAAGRGCLEAPMRVCIGGREVGPGCHVYVIAEAGVNHNGDVETALRMVEAASAAGADAVKFQMFRAAALATAAAPAAAYQRRHASAGTQRAMLAGLELTRESFVRIGRRCRECGVGFLATPFCAPEVDGVVAAGGVAVKIASPDLVDVPLLERACRTDLPVIVSTGAAEAEEIAEAVARIEAWGRWDRLILLHCVSAYPTPPAKANLAAIGTLRSRFGVVVGFSDHTLSATTGGLAVAAGACVLEKHFTLDSRAPGPDQSMSLEPDALGEYIRSARAAEEAMGDGVLGCQVIEQDVRSVGRKVVVASRDIDSGETIRPGMLTTKRAGVGLAPACLESLVGGRARVDIAADAVITRDQIA